MPLVEVIYRAAVPEAVLRALAACLPDAVSRAVECPEEPYDHHLRPGDVELRFRQSSAYDVGGIDVVVEVRSKWFASRAHDRQRRCDQLRDVLVDKTGVESLGVYLSLPVAAWSQT